MSAEIQKAMVVQIPAHCEAVMLLRAIALSFILLVCGGPAFGQVKPAEVESPSKQCKRLCGDVPCESFGFAGFDPDSVEFGYLRLVCPGPHTQARAKVKYHVKRTLKGKRKLNTVHMDLTGEVCPRCFKERKLESEELVGSKRGKHQWYFKTHYGIEMDLEMRTEEAVAWYFRVNYKGEEVYSYRGEFKEIYFGFKPRVFAAPDGQKVAVMLILDAMVKVDTALVIFSLNP